MHASLHSTVWNQIMGKAAGTVLNGAAASSVVHSNELH